jgi:hypothetical protein
MLLDGRSQPWFIAFHCHPHLSVLLENKISLRLVRLQAMLLKPSEMLRRTFPQPVFKQNVK